MLINNELIIIDLEAKDKLEVLNELIKYAKNSGKIDDEKTFLKAVLKRENEFSTGVGNGIAIPHGKSTAVKEAMVVFAKLKNTVEWEALDESPVSIVFLIGVPESNVDNLHLKILSNLSRKLIDEEFINTLKDTEEKEYILDILEKTLAL